MKDDLISDIIARLQSEQGPIPPAVAMKIEASIRRDWGGERHYIAKTGEIGNHILAARDQRIISESRRGDHDELIARRWGISTRRVRQILSAIRAAATPAANDAQCANVKRKKQRG
jgi:Mor family transcriptional regulator